MWKLGYLGNVEWDEQALFDESVVFSSETSCEPRERGLKPTVADIDRLDIQASISGDEMGYARLVGRYESQVFAQMWRFTRDRVVLDELVQDVFVEVYLSLRKYRGDAPFLHWVRRIATRVGYHYWKREYRERSRKEILASLDLPKNEEPIPAPSDAAEALFKMLEVMAPKDRLALTLYYFEDCDTKEIAERTGWSLTLVRVRIHRACKRLKHLLTEAGYGR
jgi:RNA polymerase sigma-70 factor (ECF subfamily)